MVFGDIVALAKAGYTPADVREFMAATSEKPEPGPAETTEGSKPDEQTVEKSVENVDTPTKTDPEPAKPEEVASDNKYKEMYEKAVEDLKKAQAENIRRELKPDDKTADQIFFDAAANFM